MKDLPKTIELKNTAYPILWEHLKTTKDKDGNDVTLLMPFVRGVFGLVEPREIFNNCYAKTEDGEYTKLTIGEVKGNLKISETELQERLNYYSLIEALEGKGLATNEEAITEEAKKLGTQHWHIGEAVERLSADAVKLEPEKVVAESEEEPAEELYAPADAEKIATAILGQEDRRKRYPWLFKQPGEMTDDEFATFSQALKKSYSSGKPLEGREPKPEEPKATPPPEEVKPSPKPPKTEGLFGNRHKSVTDMNDEELADYEKTIRADHYAKK